MNLCARVCSSSSSSSSFIFHFFPVCVSGAMLMAFDLRGLSTLECEYLMKAMMFSGQLLNWPGQFVDTIASLQSIGSTGNKAKPIVASAMAAIGLKVRNSNKFGI